MQEIGEGGASGGCEDIGEGGGEHEEGGYEDAGTIRLSVSVRVIRLLAHLYPWMSIVSFSLFNHTYSLIFPTISTLTSVLAIVVPRPFRSPRLR